MLLQYLKNDFRESFTIFIFVANVIFRKLTTRYLYFTQLTSLKYELENIYKSLSIADVLYDITYGKTVDGPVSGAVCCKNNKQKIV